MQRTGGLCEALWWENKGRGWRETPGLTQPDETKDILGFSLVCLVAVPHFDSPFDKTDHVFILNREGAGEVRSGGKTAKKANIKLLGQYLVLLPDLKEGERCPLEETLCIANFSVKLLWGENYMSVLVNYYKYKRTVYVCLYMPEWNCFIMIHRALLTFCEVLGETRLLTVPGEKEQKPVTICTTRLFLALHFFACLVSFSYEQWLSCSPGTLS